MADLQGGAEEELSLGGSSVSGGTLMADLEGGVEEELSPGGSSVAGGRGWLM